MFFKNTKLLSRTKRLEIQIEEFLDKVTESTELFSIAFKVYLAEGVDTQFEEFMNKIQATEREGDELRRQIETELYERTLIPDLRSDFSCKISYRFMIFEKVTSCEDHLINAINGY
ncbi:MAG TPA: DUF47 family protein, partial [Gammaproteobacteria bacterium]|nr:DUF47 family protein [Gammaproteobacteria bacterium]